MIMTVMMWALLVCFWIAAIGFAVCGFLFLFGCLYEVRNHSRDLAWIYGFLFLGCSVFSTVLVISAMAIGRNVL